MTFEEHYKKLVDMIEGDDENVLSYNTFDSLWEVQAHNESCVRIGEIEGKIIVTANSLDELLVKFEAAILDHNKQYLG